MPKLASGHSQLDAPSSPSWRSSRHHQLNFSGLDPVYDDRPARPCHPPFRGRRPLRLLLFQSADPLT
ncbi:hypothetical protein CDV31_011298 [Fusarium ambrosium]|uniref:Uncharacterized protein n=1 Tax=Fusarium ambrosium TaxID=131363 RepID=A0A428THW3_9HYPO|nr:hypothetical protein CDV31_011298 [Fusarium ambrosium]